MLRVVDLLPLHRRIAILRRLLDERTAGYDDLLALATRFNVSELTVRGRYGEFQSSASDVSILGTYARTGYWAEDTNMLIWRFFEEHGGGTYIDIGANIGLTTVPIAQNAQVRCFAIEPEPANYTNLERNVARNCFHGNVTTHQMAITAERTIVDLEIARGNLGDHRIRTNALPGNLQEHTRRVVAVEAVPLDELFGPIEGPLAVKIDTQGAEPYVVAGGERTLRQAGMLIIEFWPYGIHRLGGDVELLLRLLSAGFRISELLTEGNMQRPKLTPRRELEDLRALAQAKCEDDTYYFDIVAVS